MQYIKQQSFGRPLIEMMSLSPSSVRFRPRAASAAAPTSMPALQIEATVPSFLTVNDVDNTRVRLVRLGLTVTAAPETAIEWMRLIVRVAPAGGTVGEDDSPVICSIFPTRIDRPIAVHGRIAIDEKGEITREQTAVTVTGETHADYRPGMLGLRATRDEATWTWLPAHRAHRLGCAELFMTVACPERDLRFTNFLHLAVRGGDSGCVFLEHTSDAVAVVGVE
jgi:hypothetical protein